MANMEWCRYMFDPTDISPLVQGDASPICASIVARCESYRFGSGGIIQMVEADSLEQSVAAALQLNESEIGHLIALEQLRKTIEEALTKDLAEDHGPVAGHVQFDTATIRQKASQHFKRAAAIAEAEVDLPRAALGRAAGTSGSTLALDNRS